MWKKEEGREVDAIIRTLQYLALIKVSDCEILPCGLRLGLSLRSRSFERRTSMQPELQIELTITNVNPTPQLPQSTARHLLL